MSAYAAWLARMVALGRVSAAGLRLRFKNKMLTSEEYGALARFAGELAQGERARRAQGGGPCAAFERGRRP